MPTERGLESAWWLPEARLEAWRQPRRCSTHGEWERENTTSTARQSPAESLFGHPSSKHGWGTCTTRWLRRADLGGLWAKPGTRHRRDRSPAEGRISDPAVLRTKSKYQRNWQQPAAARLRAWQSRLERRSRRCMVRAHRLWQTRLRTPMPDAPSIFQWTATRQAIVRFVQSGMASRAKPRRGPTPSRTHACQARVAWQTSARHAGVRRDTTRDVRRGTREPTRQPRCKREHELSAVHAPQKTTDATRRQMWKALEQVPAPPNPQSWRAQGRPAMRCRSAHERHSSSVGKANTTYTHTHTRTPAGPSEGSIATACG